MRQTGPVTSASLPDQPGTSEPLLCSARGCREAAHYGLRWNNPRLHEPQRRKVWLSCAAHCEQLCDFLRARGFLREVVDVRDLHTSPGTFADLADLTGSVPAITADLPTSPAHDRDEPGRG